MGLGGRAGRRAAGRPGGGGSAWASEPPAQPEERSQREPAAAWPLPLSPRGLSAGAAVMAYCRQEGRESGLPWRRAYEGLQGTRCFATPAAPQAPAPRDPTAGAGDARSGPGYPPRDPWGRLGAGVATSVLQMRKPRLGGRRLAQGHGETRTLTSEGPARGGLHKPG